MGAATMQTAMSIHIYQQPQPSTRSSPALVSKLVTCRLTCLGRGAAPETRMRTRPPRRCLILLNTIRSQKGEAWTFALQRHDLLMHCICV